MRRILWGDLHNHNEIGYGRGSLERSYQIARETLDVYALTVHGHWPDAPSDDPRLVDYHHRAFQRVKEAFPAVIQAANAANTDGRFVAFAAYEWHSSRWGDYVVLFPGDSAELHRAQSLEELQAFVRSSGAIMIPHHVGYRLGWRGLDWNSRADDVSPVVEIFSEHGNSMDADGLWPMVTHSMGGVSRDQTCAEQLRSGRCFGFTAGTDTHFGHPGAYGEGLTAILSERLTRADILSALRNRRTYAVTGDRIALAVEMDGATLGDRLSVAAKRRMRIEVEPLGPVEFVKVIKNGRTAVMWPGGEGIAGALEPKVLCRIDWGWGRMEDADPTEWDVSIRVNNGSILRAFPCLVAGTDAVTREVRFVRISDTEFRVRSCTSRRHPSPLSGVVLDIDAGADLEIACEARTDTNGEIGGCQIRVDRTGLVSDTWAMVLPRFSSPRLRIGSLRSKSALACHVDWEDTSVSGDDYYLIQVQQKNGQLAWSSPIWFGEGKA